MSGKDFLKDKTAQIAIMLIMLVIVICFLMATRMSMVLKIYIPISIVVAYGIGLLIEYEKKQQYYNNLLEGLKNLEKKYLIAEIIEDAEFLEGKILKDVLIQTDKAMIEHVNAYQYAQEEYKEYIELWIHEIKLPIASGKLVIENNKNEVTKSMDEELDKIENYVEQALFYARSNTVEKDYYITKNNVQEMINHVLKKNKNSFIQKNVKLELNNLDKTVYTDSKWMLFIINQILNNSMQYIKENNIEITIKAEEQKEKVILSILDNGIGIRNGEIAKVFDKGFTGSNGRKNGKKSTGIGLYLCKKLCYKLGLQIEIFSEENRGTEVKIIFPKSSYLLMH